MTCVATKFLATQQYLLIITMAAQHKHLHFRPGDYTVSSLSFYPLNFINEILLY